MIPSLPALSLSSTFTEVGALVAFVAVLGIALLALLCFSQAREIKRLREWAGRAPERAAEFERAAAQAAVRAQQRVGATPVPRPTHTHAAQPADAARAPVPPPPATSIVPTPSAAPAAEAAPTTALSGNDTAPAVAMSAAASSQPAAPPIPQPVVAAAAASAPQPAVAQSAHATPPPDASEASAPSSSPLAISASDRRPVSGRGAQDADVSREAAREQTLSGHPLAPAQVAATAAVSSPGVAENGDAPPPSAPATAAGVAAAAAASAHARAPAQPERPITPPAQPERPRTPPAPALPPRRAVAASAQGLAASRSAGPLVEDLDVAGSSRAGSARLRGEPPHARGGLSPRTIALIVVGAVVAVLALLLVAGVFSGGSSSPARTAGVRATPGTAPTRRASAKHHSTAGTAGAANASEIAVVVLNGTETAGLAHRTASELVGRGYSKAVALSGKPEGSNQVSAVEYTSGHHADAAAVARSLGISTVQPVEGSTAGLAGSAAVAVVLGQDKASSGR